MVGTVLVFLPMLFGLALIFHGARRRACDVVHDLGREESPDEWPSSAGSESLRWRSSGHHDIPGDDLGAGRGRGEYGTRKLVRFLPFLSAALGAAVRLASAGPGPAVAMWGGLGFFAGVIFLRHRTACARLSYRREIEFYLPVVMEQIVMAVQAGLDILPAIKSAIAREVPADEKAATRPPTNEDPVSRLLARAITLTEAGVRFEHALRTVAAEVSSSALRHAFIHLSIAHREGGELLMPLRELSDSTQLYYQESIEEEIAKMPVKATMPLVLTFAGLIIFFLTSPLIQVMDLMQRMAPK